MHVPDGILPAQICVGGYALTGLTAWLSLRKINRCHDPAQGVPKAALLTAAFFAASLLHIPVPPASVHLVLNGLLGVILGYYAFLAILVGLFLQAIMFGHGGLSTLGVNALIMGIPALIAYFVFQLRDRAPKRLNQRLTTGFFAFLAGASGTAISALLFYSLMVLNVPAEMDVMAERIAVAGLTVAHIPLVILEGIFTAVLVLFLEKVKPELLRNTWSKASS
ncbi:MAG: cobalt transporter CbiM [Oscillatoriales cyanobacterium C42_A2020_001]|nr:cobalt transporter CbiM [Leptolyngbyaceae cyanobacterium C42_A2020_001]